MNTAKYKRVLPYLARMVVPKLAKNGFCSSCGVWDARYSFGLEKRNISAR
jgi:hypothetical protein